MPKQIYLSEARPKAEGSSELGVGKKKGTTTSTINSTTTSFVPGQTIHFLVEVLAFLSLFQLSKNFYYILHARSFLQNLALFSTIIFSKVL